MTKKQKNYRIETDLIQRVKFRAVELQTTESDLVTRYIEDGLSRDKNQTRLDDVEWVKAKLIHWN